MSTSNDGRRRYRIDVTVWEWFRRPLQMWGFVPLPEQDYRRVEDRLVHGLPSVHAPDHFRRALASNLELMAQHKRSGVLVQPVRPARTGLILGISAGTLFLIAGITLTIVLLARNSGQRA